MEYDQLARVKLMAALPIDELVTLRPAYPDGTDPLLAADHEEYLASVELHMVEHERQIGISPRGVKVAGEHKADTHMLSARAARLHAATGESHCLCHLMPFESCPVQTRKRR